MMAHLLDTWPSLVYRWVKEAGINTPEPTVSGEITEMEFDEMWHFIAQKKRKLWLIKAIDHHTRRTKVGSKSAESGGNMLSYCYINQIIIEIPNQLQASISGCVPQQNDEVTEMLIIIKSFAPIGKSVVIQQFDEVQ